jgi:hypothetical protein
MVVKRGSTRKKRSLMRDMTMMMMITTTMIQYMVPSAHTARTGTMLETDYQKTMLLHILMTKLKTKC